MKTSNMYQKHLTLDKRIKIEKGIEEGKSFSRIAEDISKSYKTVSNELKRNRNIEHCTSWYGKEKICEKTLKPPYVCNACPSRKGCRKTRYYYYAKDAQGKYEQLSMVDSYILHIISNINYTRSMSDLNRKIDAQLEQNEVMRQRSLYYASNPYARK